MNIFPTWLKIYITILVIICLFIWFGIFLPFLISASNDLLVITGLIGTIVVLILTFNYFKGVVK